MSIDLNIQLDLIKNEKHRQVVTKLRSDTIFLKFLGILGYVSFARRIKQGMKFIFCSNATYTKIKTTLFSRRRSQVLQIRRPEQIGKSYIYF